MTVGEALAEARTRAGLSVDEVSERTKIREMVIRGIEQDDYEPCGGNLFARGYVRVIAGVVGVDAQPLIRLYDETHGEGTRIAVAPVIPASPDSEPEPEPETASPAGPTADETDLNMSVLERVKAALSAPEPADPEPEPVDPEPEPEPVPAATLMETVERLDPPPLIQHGPPIHPSLTGSGKRSARSARRWGVVIAAVIVLVLIILVATRVFAGASTPSATATGTASRTANQGTASGDSTNRDNTNGDSAGRDSTGGASGTGSAADANPARAGLPVRVSQQAGKVPAPSPSSRRLTVRLAEAFGPHGTYDGDHPAAAMNPVTRGSTQPWSTDWYASARFGQLKSGTGLLLDMGRRVTVTSVIVNLGTGTDASLELWAGNTPGLSGLHVKASGARLSGNVVLRLRAPARARYLLVWFTVLPPAANGQYQADVHDITVEGT